MRPNLTIYVEITDGPTSQRKAVQHIINGIEREQFTRPTKPVTEDPWDWNVYNQACERHNRFVRMLSEQIAMQLGEAL